MTTLPHDRSDSLHEAAVRLTPGGVHSNVRMAGPLMFFERAKGAWLWDVDGNDYVDYLLGQGPNFLGHAHPEVNRAVADACQQGMVYGAQHPLEVTAGQRFVDAVEWPDMVRFGLSGTEMVQAAIRLARAVTGRERFVRFQGHYHGWLDNVLLAYDEDGGPIKASEGQLQSHIDDSFVLPWNDADALETLLAERGEQVAAVIMEPFMCNTGAVSPRPGYLEQVRALCDEHQVVLIFDEVITGFRLALGGAAERFGVTPDLATYGKAMAGGYPVAALAGRGELMERFASGVNHSGTFNASVMASAAVDAALRVLSEDPPYERIEQHGQAVLDGLLELGSSHGVPLRAQGVGPAFHVSFGESGTVHDFSGIQRLDLGRYSAFVPRLAEHGVWVAGRGIWYVSAVHGDKELTTVLERFDAALGSGEV